MNSAITNDAKATKIFIASGADVNQKNLAGVTALHLAARNNSFESAQILIENGAEVNEKDSEGWTPLMRASLAGNSKMMQLLIENGAQIWIQNNFGETALMHTAMADCYECGKLIANNDMPNNYLTKSQIKQSLEIVNKRYNEPFIKLLSQYANIETILVLDSDVTDKKDLTKAVSKDTAKSGTITELIYNFTGKISSIDKTSVVEKTTKPIVKDTIVESSKYKLIQPTDSKITTEKPVDIKTGKETVKTPTEATKYKLSQQNGSKIVTEKPIMIIREDQETTDTNKDTLVKTSKYKFIQKNEIEKEKNEPIKTKKTEVENKPTTYSFTGTEKKLDKTKEENESNKEQTKYKLNSLPLKSETKKEKNTDKNYSFNSGMEEKKKNMKLINNNDKLNPDNLNYKLKSDEKPLNN